MYRKSWLLALPLLVLASLSCNVEGPPPPGFGTPAAIVTETVPKNTPFLATATPPTYVPVDLSATSSIFTVTPHLQGAPTRTPYMTNTPTIIELPPAPEVTP